MKLEQPVQNPIVSIQVQTIKVTGARVSIVPYGEVDCKATHWSIYFRLEDGSTEWHLDVAIPQGKRAAQYYSEAVLVAAKLSMSYQVPIEKIL